MASKPAAAEAKELAFKTTGLRLPEELWIVPNRVAFERARPRGGRASVWALLVQLVKRHELELKNRGRRPPLSGKRVGDMLIPLPHSSEQPMIVSKVERLDAQTQRLHSGLSASDEDVGLLMPSILDQAFSGHL